MFKIYGGLEKFQQWSLNQKLSMKELPIGAEVLFYQDPYADDPLITEVYTFEGGNVCNVPNILLQSTRKIKVRIPEKIVGIYGVVHKYAGGPRERYFEIEAREKPDDYVYEETPTEGCSGGGSVSEEQVETAVKNYLDVSGILPMGEGVTVWAEIVD